MSHSKQVDSISTFDDPRRRSIMPGSYSFLYDPLTQAQRTSAQIAAGEYPETDEMNSTLNSAEGNSQPLEEQSLHQSTGADDVSMKSTSGSDRRVPRPTSPPLSAKPQSVKSLVRMSLPIRTNMRMKTVFRHKEGDLSGADKGTPAVEDKISSNSDAPGKPNNLPRLNLPFRNQNMVKQA